MDNNHLFRNIINRANSPAEQFDLAVKNALSIQLEGKSNANYNKSTYSETTLTESSQNEVDYGMLLSVNELKENEVFRKLVLFSSYSTRPNKFRPEDLDVVYDFIDRDGTKVRSNKWSQLDTSNALKDTERLNELVGSVILLEGRLIRSGDRHFIDIIRVYPAPIDQELYKPHFKLEVSNLKDEIDKFKKKIGFYPLSNRIFNSYDNVICYSHLKGVLEKKGSYLRSVNYFLDSLEHLNCDNKYKDLMIAYDIINQLRKFEDINNLINTLYNDCIGIVGAELFKSLIEDVFSDEPTPSILQIMSKEIRRGAISIMLLENWNKIKSNEVYSNFHKSLISLRRGDKNE